MSHEGHLSRHGLSPGTDVRVTSAGWSKSKVLDTDDMGSHI
jgi:hypothetical protein